MFFYFLEFPLDFLYRMPLSYSGDALTKIIMYGDGFNSIAFDILILLIFLVGLTTANIIGLKRYRKV